MVITTLFKFILNDIWKIRLTRCITTTQDVSREGLAYLNENNIHPNKEYLKDLITKEELKSILKKLNIEPDLSEKTKLFIKQILKGKI